MTNERGNVFPNLMTKIRMAQGASSESLLRARPGYIEKTRTLQTDNSHLSPGIVL